MFIVLCFIFFILPLTGIGSLPLAWAVLADFIVIAGICISTCYSPRWTDRLIYLLTIGLMGTAISAGRTLPSPWWYLAYLVFLSSLIFPSLLVYWLGMANDEQADSVAIRKTPEENGPVAIRPVTTPEGVRIRYQDWGWGDHGEPASCNCLMPDGVYLIHLEMDCCFSDDGRYFVARNASTLFVLDRQQCHLHQVKVNASFGMIHKCERGRIHLRDGVVELSEVLKGSAAVALIPVSDLWVAPETMREIKTFSVQWPTGPHGQRREGRLFLPAGLRSRKDPLDPLSYPRYQLWLDGQPGDVVLDAEESLCDSPSSPALACKGWSLARLQHNPELWRGEQSYWWWRPRQGWLEFTPAIPEAGRLPVSWGQVQEVSEENVWIAARLDSPVPSRGWFGLKIESWLGDSKNARRGYDSVGRLLMDKLSATQFEVLWPVPAKGLRIRSLPVADGRRLTFVEHNRRGAQVAYAVSLGEQSVPGLWQLDFRISEEGTHIALLPACHPKALSDRVVVLEIATGSLYTSPPLLVERICDFANGTLEVLELCGLYSQDFKSHPLHLADLPPPLAGHAAKFYTENHLRRAVHRLRQLRISAAGLKFQPEWRQVHCSQIASAGEDFILPAPSALDAAWLRGTETNGVNSFLYRKEPRFNGYLLTASGCAIFGVTPTFAWSADGRYLALTHLIRWNEPDNTDPQHRDQWQLWLLDTQHRSLRIRPGSIGRMPHFREFENNAWYFRAFSVAWDDPKETGWLKKVTLQELLRLPEEQLVQRERFWHRPREQQPLAHWQAFDEAVLAPWRKGASKASR